MFGLKTGRVGRLGIAGSTGGKRPALTLNFNDGSSVDSRLTYTGSGGTYFDSSSTLRLASANVPRIDYGPTQSGVTNFYFPSTNWFTPQTPTGVVDGRTQNAGTDPLGGNSAMLLIPGTFSSASHQFFTFFTSGQQTSTIYTYSVYLKASGGYDGAAIQLSNTAFPALQAIAVNLTLGTIVAQAANASGTITSVGNGWYRVSVTNISGPTGGNYITNIVVYDTAAHAAATTAYTGNGTSGVLVWGNQVEISGSMGTYVPTTNALATAGASALGMLMEEGRTNSIRNPRAEGAVVGTPGTYPTNWVQGNSTTLIPNVIGFGTENGIPYIDLQLTGTASAGINSIFFEGPTSIAAATAQVWTGSFYCRLVGGSLTNVTSVQVSMQEKDSGGVFVAFGTSSALTVSGSSLGTPRDTLTYTLTGGVTTAFIQPELRITLAAGAVNVTLRIGAPQLELGAFVTSPILPAIGTPAASTRVLDVASMSATGWVGAPASGTLVSDAKLISLNSSVAQTISILSDGSTANRMIHRDAVGTSNAEALVNSGGVLQSSLVSGVITFGTAFKMGGTWTPGAQKTAFNGVLGPTAAGASSPVSLTTLSIGSSAAGINQANGWIKRIRYWSRVLSDSELTQVTT